MLITLLGDKVEWRERGGATFVKLVARMDEARYQVKVTCIDIQGARNSSICDTDTINHALKVCNFLILRSNFLDKALIQEAEGRINTFLKTCNCQSGP